MADNWLLKAVLSATDNLSPVLKGVGNVAKTTRKYLADVASSANALTSKIGLPLAALSGVMGGFSLVAIKNAMVGFGEMGDAIYKGSIRTGMSVEQFQRMKYVAEQAGVGVEMLEGAMGKLNLNMGNAAGGKNKNVSALFKRLGVDVKDANGHIKAGVDILPQLADAFQRNKDPAVQARMGMALFGKKWQEIAPMLMQGGAGIAETLERMKKFKGVMGDDDIEGARQFARSMRDLDFVTKGFQMTIAKNLAPVIKPLIEDFAEWAAANKKLISAEVGKMAKDLGAWIKDIDWTAAIQGIKDFGNSLSKLVDSIGGAKNALIALVIVMNMQAIMATAALLGSIWRLVYGLGAMALSALAPIAPLQLLQAEMVAAGMKGAALVGTLGKISAAAGVLGAAWAGWELGKLLNEYVINPGIQKLTGDKDQTLGGWIYDKMNPQDMALAAGSSTRRMPLPGDNLGGPRPSLLGLPQQSGGKFTFDFVNAPPGMRLTDQETKGPAQIDMSVGTRGFALGMPYG